MILITKIAISKIIHTKKVDLTSFEKKCNGETLVFVQHIYFMFYHFFFFFNICT